MLSLPLPSHFPFQSVPQGQKSKTICCLCCASGAIEAIVRINRKGHVPGEAIAIDAEVTNRSNRRINCTKLQLVQVSEASWDIFFFGLGTSLYVETLL